LVLATTWKPVVIFAVLSAPIRSSAFAVSVKFRATGVTHVTFNGDTSHCFNARGRAY
jgi:hypothetical protein